MPILHGQRPILGFRFGAFAYLTDCSRIPDESWPLLEGLDDAGHRRAARSAAPDAFHVDEAIDAARRIGARRDLLHAHVPRPAARRHIARACRPGMELAYDGLVMKWPVLYVRVECEPAIHFPDDPAAAVAPAGAGAGQLRRAASRPHEDHRPRAAARRRARRHAGGDDLRSASAARAAARQGAAAADDRRRRSSRRSAVPACRGWPSFASRASCRPGIRRRSCAPCWSSGCTSPRSGSARIFSSATTAPARSRCCAVSARATVSAPRRSIPVRYKDFVVSSTRIRRLVSEGRVDEAGALLGHHYFIDGTVTRGAGRGRELGFPTANSAPATSSCPRPVCTRRS